MMYDDKNFKNKIIEKAKELIETDENVQTDCPSFIKKNA